jgi:hypothetical protein
MALTVCGECGTVVPAPAHACPKCGAAMAPVPYAAPRPEPRPPQAPERPWWRTPARWGTAAGWVVVIAGFALFGSFLFRLSTEVDQRSTEETEVAREREHMLKVEAWARDTSFDALVPESAGRPVPTSNRAKRMWVISRMLVDGSVWRLEIMKRHGLAGDHVPAAWGTPRYYANARAFPEVKAYVENRVAAIAEIEKTSAAWMEGRIVALARESGLPADEIRELLPRDLVGLAPDEVTLSEAMLQMHRHLVRIDPRVHGAGGNELRFEREDDVRSLQALETELNEVSASVEQGRARKLALDRNALLRAIQ